MDSLSEATGGSFEFSTSIGGSFNTDVNVFGIEADLDMSAKAGAHLELEVEKKQNTDIDFGVDVEVRTERNITQVDKDGNRTLQPGKVDAYRFMTFYLRPDSDHHDVFFNEVVDPIWLEQSDEPSAAAALDSRPNGAGRC